MGERIRAFDWSSTPLGPLANWPQSLRSAVSILLPSKAQISLFWGPDLVTIYNDAYRPVFGAKHPSALGRPIREAWDRSTEPPQPYTAGTWGPSGAVALIERDGRTWYEGDHS